MDILPIIAGLLFFINIILIGGAWALCSICDELKVMNKNLENCNVNLWPIQQVAERIAQTMMNMDLNLFEIKEKK